MESKLSSKNPCKRFAYLGPDGPVFVDKKRYDTRAEAKRAADKLNMRPDVIHMLAPYLCPICGKWHIGRSEVEVTNYRKRQLRNNSFTTEGERELDELKERIAHAPKIDLSKL
jgi:hypothetical protein